jgi:hypothetical protein
MGTPFREVFSGPWLQRLVIWDVFGVAKYSFGLLPIKKILRLPDRRISRAKCLKTASGLCLTSWRDSTVTMKRYSSLHGDVKNRAYKDFHFSYSNCHFAAYAFWNLLICLSPWGDLSQNVVCVVEYYKLHSARICSSGPSKVKAPIFQQMQAPL